ncbi:MAG TPA: ATP-binding protein [Candidatus Deferrimicrobium sp.]|nr:ATP-binding protein [Candidatus Deferrimicrobium sp.]
MATPFDYISPSPSKLFVGRSREITNFKEQLQKVIAGERTEKGILIHGRPGIGKTSLMNKLKEVAESSCYVISTEVPLVGSAYFFDDLKGAINEVTKDRKSQKPIKRGKSGKNAPYIQRAHEIIDLNKYYLEFYKKFTKGLDGNQKNIAKKGKRGLVIFIDKIERFAYLDQMIAFDLLKGICENITTEIKGKPFNIPILFVISAWARYVPKIKYVLTNFKEIGVPTLGLAEARDLFTKHASAAGLSFSDEVSELIIESSLNIPQMILYNGKYISDNRKDAREITKDLWYNFEAGVKSGFTRELDQVDENERKILQAFSMEKENFADVLTLAQGTDMQINECEKIIQKLASKKIISKEGDYYYLTLNSFWEFLRNSLGDIAIGAQARGIIRVAAEDADNGRLFSDFLFEEMERLRNDAITAGLVAPIELIARGYERIFDSCFRYEYYSEAFKYILLAGQSYVKINEIEKSAYILERATNQFKEKQLGDYARDTLTQTIETYNLLGNQAKVQELKLDLVQLCQNKAEESLGKNSFPLARANFSRAERLLEEIGENQKLIEMIESAANTFMEKKEYFYAWQFFGKLSEIYLKTGDKSNASEVLKYAAENFTTIGQTKFADKLNEQLKKKIPAGAL